MPDDCLGTREEMRRALSQTYRRLKRRCSSQSLFRHAEASIMREPSDMVTQGCGEGLLAVLGLMQLGTWKWEKIGGNGKGNAAVWWLAKLLRNHVKLWCDCGGLCVGWGDLLSGSILSEFHGLALMVSTLVLTTQPLVAWHSNHVTTFALVMRMHLN